MANEVHLWAVRLAESAPEVDRLWSVLSTPERAKADRLERSLERHRFLVGHAAMRLILNEYLEGALGQRPYAYGPHGKPVLPPLGGWRDGLSFNLAHSGDWALCAVALGRPVGVDIEYRQRRNSMERVAERIFTPAELAAFQALAEAERVSAFFQCWTRKEACAKADGLGLTSSLRRWEVGWTDHDQPGSGLTVRNLAVADEYLAAVAASGTDWTAHSRSWSWAGLA